MSDPVLDAAESSRLIYLGCALDHLDVCPTYETQIEIATRLFEPDAGGLITMTIEDVVRRPTMPLPGTDCIFVRFISARGDLSFKGFPVEGRRKDGKPHVLGLIDLLGAAGVPTYDVVTAIQEGFVSFESVAKALKGKKVGAKLTVAEYNGQKTYEIVRLFRADWLRDREVEAIVTERLDDALKIQKLKLAASLFKRGFATLAHDIEIGAFDADLV